MSFLLVDRITKFQSGKYVQGLKHISASEPYLTYSQSSNSVIFLPALLGEAVGQMAAWSVMHALDFNKRPVAGIVSQVNIYGEAKVGDTLVMSADIDQLDGEAVEYHGQASINGKTIFEIESAIGPMVDMVQMNNRLEVLHQFSMINHAGNEEHHNYLSEGTIFPELDLPNKINPYGCFDRIVNMSADTGAIAEKNISLSAPYFIDHFPNKPVLPLTILLNCKIELAQLYIRRYLSINHYSVRCARKIKMSQFVEPGQVVQTIMKVKPKNEELIFQFKSYVAEQRVCVCEVVFAKL